MHDEASPFYVEMVDQTTRGHDFLKAELGAVPKIGWQIDPFGHSAVQADLLSAELGFEAPTAAVAALFDVDPETGTVITSSSKRTRSSQRSGASAATPAGSPVAVAAAVAAMATNASCKGERPVGRI